MSSLITVVGRAGLNRNVFRSQEDILSRSKVFFCPSTWLEGVDQKASSEVAILEINCDNMVRLTKCMSGSRKLFLSIYSPQKYKNGTKLAYLLKNRDGFFWRCTILGIMESGLITDVYWYCIVLYAG